MSISKFRRALFATAAVLASSSAAFAQTQTAANTTGGIETVVVTAQYKLQNLQSTPLSITAVTANDLEQRGIKDLSQLATSVPGLTLTKTPAAFGSGVQTYIRGIGQYDTAFASEPGVGMYIDDEYYGTLFGSNMELLDLSRVEVLRGPQGVLGGKDNIGGAIKLYSKQPTGDDSGYVEASYGSFNEIDVKGAIDATVIPDRLFARISALSRHQDGYMDIIDYTCKFGPGNGPTGAGGPTAQYPDAVPLPSVSTSHGCKIGTLGGTDVTGARVAFRGIIHEGMEDNFDAYVIRDNSETQAGSLIVADPGQGAWNPGDNVYYWNGSKVVAVPRTTFFPANSDGVSTVTGPGTWNSAVNLPRFGIPWDQRFIPQNPYRQTYATYTTLQGNQYRDGARVHAWGLNNQFDWDILSNVHFKNILGYREYQAANSNDSDLSPMSYQLTTSYPSNDEFQEEARFTGTLFDDHLDWTGGFFYYHRNNHEKGPVDIEGALAPFLIFEQNDLYQSTSRSVYLHGIYHIWDNLEIFAGVRYSSESKTLYFDHSGPVPGYPGSGFFRSTVDPNLDCNLFAGHACDHSINPPLLAHTSKVSRPDWRAGVDYHVTDDIMTYFQFSTGYRTGGFNSRPFTPAQLDSYGPEHLAAYEIGAKTDWFDHRLRLNVSLYRSEYSDIITPTAGTDPYLPGILPYVKYVNLASATNEGFELEVTANPVSNLLIDASYSYVNFSAEPVPGAPAGWLDGCSAAGYAAHLCDANPHNLGFGGPAPHTAPGTTRVGSHPILFPANTAHIGAQWPFMLGQGLGSLTPRLDYSWQDTIYQGANNDPYTAIKSRGLLDGRLTWDAPSGGWSVALSGSNLTGKKYFLNVFNLSIFGQGSVEGQPGTPREWLITVKKAF